MASPPIRYCVNLAPPARHKIETALADQRTLDRVIQWGLASEPRRAVELVVAQDEYTNDVVLPWGDGLFLVYDCT